jgi:ATP-binding cassette subfamily F protein 3
MLTFSEVNKGFGGRTLFAGVNLQVNRLDRVGLVGPNGAGKSTLFRMILGEEAPDAGKILIERNAAIGHLPQESAPVGEETVLELVTAIDPELSWLQREIRTLEANPELAHAHDTSPHARYAELGGPQVEAKAKKMMAGLSFRESDYTRPARSLSGGWVMRAHLARLLVQEPDLLMLDEPTNHLDLETLLWFQDYLKRYPGALLVISHDREFLNHLVESVLEIRQARLFRYRGTYDDYLTQREANEAQRLAAYKNQQREIGRLMEFINRFRAKNTKATQAQSKLKQIERMEKIEAPGPDDPEIDFRFPQPPRSGLKVCTLKGIDHAYADAVVYRGLDFQAERGQRIVLVGPNGAGKSTLLKLLAGVLPVQVGTRQLGYQVKVGYYAQYRTDVLHSGWTVLEEALNTPQSVTEQFVRTVLGGFLFHGDDVYKPVRVLSGGEKSRLVLVKLLLDPPNLLLMDEPTTHLDLSSVDALLAALDQYEGTLIFISHDVYFIRSLANHVVQIRAGQLAHYPGDYQYYLDKNAALAQQEALGTVSAPEAEERELAERPSVRMKEQKRLEAEERQARYRQRKAQEAVVEKLEEEILALESRQAELTAALQRPETYQQAGPAREFNLELAQISRELKDLTRQWEVEADRLSELQQRE